MAALPVRDSLADLERHRARLEETISKLRRALRHWQTWEAEYEGLKEEILELPADATRNDLLQVGRDLGGDLVTEKELSELVGRGKGIERNGRQVVQLIDRRIEYVQRNVESIKKQLDDTQLKLDSVYVVSQPEVRNEDGLPITEIYEELDEDGNVIASHTSRPEDAKPQILDALKRIGLNELDAGSESTPSQSNSLSPSSSTTKSNEGASSSTKAVSQAEANKLVSTPSVAKNDPNIAEEPLKKKSVSFAEDTKGESLNSALPAKTVQPAGQSLFENKTSKLAKGSFSDQERVIELDDNDIPISSTGPRTNVDESPEDAALRRRMQEYSMRRVGEVVAQLDLEPNEDDSQDSYDDEDSENDENGGAASSDDDENQYGIDIQGQLSEEYKQEMLELEKKLNARMLQNVGPNPSVNGDKELSTDARRLVVQRETVQDEIEESNSPFEIKPKEKSVRFAEELDIAPSSDPKGVTESSQEVSSKPNTAVKDIVAERKASVLSSSEPPRQASRFKMAQQARSAEQPANETATQETKRTPLAADIIERSPRSRKSATNEFDPKLMQQEVNNEYYRQRNRLIQKQGGFKRHMNGQEDFEPDGDEGENDEAQIPKKKVSLFKAARAQIDGPW